MDNKIIVTIGQLLKLTPYLNTYLTTISKQFVHNEGSTSKAIIIVATMAIDHQMEVIVVHVGKNMVDDVFLDGELKVNAIIDGLRQNLGLRPPQLAPFNFKMANFSFSKPLGIVPNIRIKIHGILYIVTFMVMNNKAIDPTHYMLLGRPCLRDAKVIHDWGTNMVTIKGNGIINTIFVYKYLSGNIRRL
jgi:hypothetical protein